MSSKRASAKRASSTVSTTTSSDEEAFKKETSGFDMKKILHETKVTFGMAEGEHKSGDVSVETIDEGLELLQAHVQEKDRQFEESEDDSLSSWMDLVPLNEFHATPEEFLSAFLKWTIKDEDPDSDSKKKKKGDAIAPGMINVTKASRRLDSYFEWMKENMAESMKENPLTNKSVKAAAKVWDIQVTIDDTGRFVWWVELGKIAVESVKDMDPMEHVRYVVWFSHLVILNKDAQDNGTIIIEDLGHIGFWKLATLVPMDLSAKLDRFTIGVCPIKMKGIYIFGAATWMHVMMKLIKPFMSKKMQKRMVIINEKKTNMQEFCDDLVSRKNVVQGFSGLEGGSERDAIYSDWKKPKKDKKKKSSEDKKAKKKKKAKDDEN